jgi:signal transduction histidine kinase
MLNSELQIQDKLLQQRVDNKRENIEHLIKLRQNSLLRVYTVRLENIIKSNSFKYYIKYPDRETIQKSLDYKFKAMRRENIGATTLQLVDKNNISIYRAHMPDKYGDDLTDKRELIKKTNAQKIAHHGYEVGKYTINYRIDVPIIYDGVHYGLLDLGIDIRYISKTIESVFKDSMALILLKNNKAQYLENNDNLNRFNNEYLVFYKNKKLANIEIDLTQKYIKVKNKTYFIYIDNNSNSLIKSIYLFDMSNDIKEFEDTKDRIIIGTMILIIMTTILLYISFTLYEKELDELYRQNNEKDKMIHQQSKLATMGEMLSMIAHQWRQPLNVLNGVIMTMNLKKETDTLSKKDLTRHLEHMKNTIRYLSNTINDFRKFFDKEKNKDIAKVDNIFDKSIAIIDHRVNENSVSIIKNIEYLYPIQTYPNELQQLFLNIINNSLDEFEKNNIQNAQIKLNLSEIDDKHIEIRVIDNGGGIDDAIIDNIFDPYFSTKSKNGTGLGLYMSKIIVTEHLNGQLSVLNTDNGACFIIILPKEIKSIEQ